MSADVLIQVRAKAAILILHFSTIIYDEVFFEEVGSKLGGSIAEPSWFSMKRHLINAGRVIFLKKGDFSSEEIHIDLIQLVSNLLVQIHALRESLLKHQTVIDGIMVSLPNLTVKTNREAPKFTDESGQTPETGSDCQARNEIPVNVKAVDPIKAIFELPPRQVEVLNLISQGFTYKEIAEKLFITERTVKYHMKEILVKLQLKSRSQAIALIRKLKFTK